MKSYAFALLPLLALAAPAHASFKIVSYVETSGAAHSDPVVNFNSGQIAQQNADGATNKAVTGIGTNKIFSSGNGTSELNAGSAWMDSYTVNGTGSVNVHLSFTIDGSSAVGANLGGAGSDANPFDWTYRVVALKGGNWNLGGQGSTGTAGINYPVRSNGDNYESMLLSRMSQADPSITSTYQPRFGGGSVWNVKNFGDEPGEYAPSVARNGNNMSYYTIENGNSVRRLYTATRVSTYLNGSLTPVNTTNYTTSATDPNRAIYNALLASYPILAQNGLCTVDEDSGLCPGMDTYDPTTVNLDFTLQAGEQFTLLSYLSFINLRDGEFDFYNTAKLSGITLSNGATLTSSSGMLQQMAGGGYGYAPLMLGVPEPAQWALMIGGFGLIGGASRRRQRQAAKAASIAVGAPRNA